MTRLFKILLLIVFGGGFQSVHAVSSSIKNTSEIKNNFDPSKIPKKSFARRSLPPSRGRWNISLVYNSADQVKYGGNVDLLTGTQRFALTGQTTPQFGFSVGYTFLKSGNFGYSADFVYELPRPSKGIKGTAGDLKIDGQVDGDKSISLATVNVTGNYSFGDRFYIFAGVNHPVPTSPPDDKAKLSGLIGYQAGAAYVINRNFILESAYRLTAFRGHFENQNMDFDIKEANIVGLLFQLRYRFR